MIFTEKVWKVGKRRTHLLFVELRRAYSTNVVLNVKGEWHTPNTLPTMVQRKML